jgi:hypothetical protein
LGYSFAPSLSKLGAIAAKNKNAEGAILATHIWRADRALKTRAKKVQTQLMCSGGMLHGIKSIANTIIMPIIMLIISLRCWGLACLPLMGEIMRCLGK